MIYDFQLHFTGLCLVHSSGTVFLVNATDPESYFSELEEDARPNQHAPRLVVDPRYLHGDSSRKADGLCVGPTGEDSPLFDLSWQRIEILIPDAADLEIPKGRKPANRPPYINPTQGGARPYWFDWVISVPSVGRIQAAHITGLRDSCWQNPAAGGPVIARVKLNGGRLETSSHSRISGEYAAYDFRGINPATESLEQGHVFGDRATLWFHGIENEDPVRIEITKNGVTEVVLLRPPDGETKRRVVQASITNMEIKYQKPREIIYDFLWFYRLFDWYPSQPDIKDIPIPHPPMAMTQLYTPSSTTCPPGGG